MNPWSILGWLLVTIVAAGVNAAPIMLIVIARGRACHARRFEQAQRRIDHVREAVDKPVRSRR